MAQLPKNRPLKDADSINVISLADIRDKYDGSLAAYLKQNDLADVIIILPAEIEVEEQGKMHFFAVMAVTVNFIMPEMLEPFAKSLAAENQQVLFSWVPAHLFGSDDFYIHIENSEYGENLVNGLVGEIVREANIEDAVAFLANQ
ncbi:MAG: hypothetical protein HOI17_03505 [Alphaproteobacteria bacterium]|nr:hypothetical protein [Alphaproteobacteria bacterium]MBT5798890.1 hypothetical protein [Alphaproteobacteria bacterium]